MTRAVRAVGYGGPEVLAVQDVTLPEIGPGQVLIDVRAAGVNPFDHRRYGGLMGTDPAALPMPLGFEAAGTVSAIGGAAGAYTGDLAVGDEVIADNLVAGYADRVLADAADVGHKPAALSFEQAAGLLVAATTAWHLLAHTGVAGGDTVLIHGAGGGVGLMAVQLAVARGAAVIATTGPAGDERLRGYGATPVRYGAGLTDRVRAVGPVHAAVDLVGTDEALDASVTLVAQRSRIATIAGFARAGELGIATLTRAGGGAEIRDAARPTLIALAADGKLDVTVDATFDLARAGDAHRYLRGGHAHGKVVLVA